METLILLAGVILLGLAVTIVVRALTLPTRGELIEQIGTYGYEPTLTSAPVEAAERRRSIEEIAGSLSGLFSRKTRQLREQDLRAKLVAAGQYTASPRTFFARQLLLAVGCLVAWIAVAALGGASAAVLVLGVLIAPLFGWSLPSIMLKRQIKDRYHAIDRELPAMIDLLVVTVEAGIGFVGSLRMATQQLEGPLAEELRLALHEQSMGLSTGEAIQGIARRADTPGIRSFSRAIVQGETLGVSIGQILRNLSEEMRKRRRSHAEEQAQKAPVKMLFPLVFLIFPAMFVVLLLPAIISIANTLSG